MNLYALHFEWDGEYWFVRIPSLVGVHSQAKTIDEARRRYWLAFELIGNADPLFGRFVGDEVTVEHIP